MAAPSPRIVLKGTGEEGSAMDGERESSSLNSRMAVTLYCIVCASENRDLGEIDVSEERGAEKEQNSRHLHHECAGSGADELKVGHGDVDELARHALLEGVASEQCSIDDVLEHLGDPRNPTARAIEVDRDVAETGSVLLVALEEEAVEVEKLGLLQGAALARRFEEDPHRLVVRVRLLASFSVRCRVSRVSYFYVGLRLASPTRTKEPAKSGEEAEGGEGEVAPVLASRKGPQDADLDDDGGERVDSIDCISDEAAPG